jgi:hypothetical protein
MPTAAATAATAATATTTTAATATATTAATDPKGLIIWKENLQTHMKILCMQLS